jgi:hypothetical protein
MRLKIRKLKTLNVINENSCTEVLEALCCDSKRELCLDRKCDKCRNKGIKINEFTDEAIVYQKWVRQRVPILVKGNMKVCMKTVKIDIQSSAKDLLETFLEDLLPFLNHASNIVHQYEETTKIKQNLAKNEIFVHIDFSENYECKYHREIQSAHFGGSKPQVTIHTGVVYFHNDIKSAPMSFGTVSQCNRHDAAAVVAHLLCLENEIKAYVPDLKKVNMLSDGPSTQYKNRSTWVLN